WVYPIRLEPAMFQVTRDEFSAALRAEGIPAGFYPDRPVYMEHIFLHQAAYSRGTFPFAGSHYDGCVEYRPGMCETAERYLATQITLPCHHGLQQEDMEDVVAAVQKVAEATLRWPHEIATSSMAMA